MSETRDKKCHGITDSEDAAGIHGSEHRSDDAKMTAPQQPHRRGKRRQRFRPGKWLKIPALLIGLLVVATVAGRYCWPAQFAHLTTTLHRMSRHAPFPKEIKLPLPHYSVATTTDYSLEATGGGGRRITPKEMPVAVRFSVPDRAGTELELQIYGSPTLDGTFKWQKNDYAAVSAPKPIVPFSDERIRRLPPKMRRDALDKNAAARKSPPKKAVVSFQSAVDNTPDNRYLLLLLRRTDGTTVFAHTLMPWKEPPNMIPPVTELSRALGDGRDMIYFAMGEVGTGIVTRFADPNACRLETLTVDGVAVPAIMAKWNSVSVRNRNGTVRRIEQHFIAIQQPGAKATATFRIDGKKVILNFSLPPPPPRTMVREVQGIPQIRWLLSGKLDAKDYVRMPRLLVSRHDGIIGEYALNDPRTSVRDLCPRRENYYDVVLIGGELKNIYWTRAGVKDTTTKLNYIQRNPLSLTIAPVVEEPPRQLRIALLNCDICYQNTGIPAFHLLAAVAEKLIADPKLNLLDQEARQYLDDREQFRMSPQLLAAFSQDRADFIVYIRDYSRASGNGVELWLNRVGTNDWWRCAAIDNRAPEQDKQFAAAATTLHHKILALNQIPPPTQPTPHLKVPDQIIMAPIRPLNQPQVITESAAISESIMLQLSDRNPRIKIIAKADWQMALKERLQLGGNGGGYDFVNRINDVLVNGRMWRDGREIKYIFKACDVLTGEVLGTKTCGGGIDAVAADLDRWLGPLKLKARNHTPATAKHRWRSDWFHSCGLIRYGTFFGDIPRLFAGFRPAAAADVFALAQKNWQDGYRDQAVRLIAQEWQTKQSTKAGAVLIRYYYQLQRYREAQELCQTLMKRDECPEWVVATYNQVRKMAKVNPTGRAAVAAIPTPPSDNTATNPAPQRIKGMFATYDFSHRSLDSGGTKYYLEKGQKKQRDILNGFAANPEDDFRREYLIDRDYCGTEWGPNKPCTIAMMAFNLPGNRLSEGIYNPIVSRYGVWLRALLRTYETGRGNEKTMSPQRLEKRYRSNRERREASDAAMVIDAREMARISEEVAENERQYHHTVLVVSAGWNTIDPFREDLPPELQFSRLAYFFNCFHDTWPLNGYRVSYVRALMELQRHPQLSFPDFIYYDSLEGKVHHSEIRTGTDLINSFVNAIDDDPDKYFYTIKLEHLLAAKYMTECGYPRARKIYAAVMERKIPTDLREMRQSKYPEAWLVFLAGQKNPAAGKLLREYWQKQDPDYNGISDYLYYLAQCGDIELTALLLKRKPDSCRPRQLRWAPPQVLHTLLCRYRKNFRENDFCYLVLGSHDTAAAWELALKHPSEYENLLMQFYGCPNIELAERVWDALSATTGKTP
ncbi:MAG: hypothetical protein PHQ27_06315 [Victivallales bacterium]|nr:hypothetical protein [Victivallales bacterium]